MDKPESCAFCHWETEELTECEARWPTPTSTWLCEVCRSTAAGNMHLYPVHVYHATAPVASTVAWGINAILAKLDAIHASVRT